MKPNQNGTPAAEGATRIALVLDRSGSMGAIQEEARSAFNEAVDRVVEEAAKGAGEVTLTLLAFNDEIDELLVNRPADQVRKLGPADYRPGGMTALFDAVGHGIDLLERSGPLGEEDAALVIVVSDGAENSSRKVSQSDLVERMQALKTTGQWTFTFMCANVDITDLTRQLGVAAGNAARWQATKAGVEDARRNLSDSMVSYMADRRSGIKSKTDFWEEES